MVITLSNWASFYTQNLHKLRKAFQQVLILENCMSPKLFTPTYKHFLHGYIRHIHDISQLWSSQYIPTNPVLFHSSILRRITLPFLCDMILMRLGKDSAECTRKCFHGKRRERDWGIFLQENSEKSFST